MSRLQLQPRLKSLATSNLSSQPAFASPDPLSRPETPNSRQSTRFPSADPLSDRATLFLIRRTLCSQLGEKGRSTPAPIDEILPPLTSSNEIDLQLYAFIAIIIREFVQTWYTKITPDHVFVEEIVKIIAHCTRALEQRLRKVDLESLLFDDLPDLLEVHIQAYRAAHHIFNPLPVKSDPRQVYHALCPFPALSPVPHDGDQDSMQHQMENEAVYRQLLVQGALAVLLPTEDLENDCLTTLVGQIFSQMILGGGVGGKASEPWLLWDGIAKITEVIQSKLPESMVQVQLDRSNSSPTTPVPLEITGQKLRSWRIGRSIQKTFWLVLQCAFLTFTATRFLIVSLVTSSSLPSRMILTAKTNGSMDMRNSLESPGLTGSKSMRTDRMSCLKQPILKMKIWTCAASLLDINVRMPWLSATISMLQWGAIVGPGGLGNTDGMIDKFLSHAIQKHVLDPTLLPLLLRVARAALFPNNTLAPPRIAPSASDQLLIRKRCAETILSLIPPSVHEIYFGAGKDRRVKEVEEVLNIFNDSYCNKHLLYSVVELILVRLIPELAENGIESLLEERLN